MLLALMIFASGATASDECSAFTARLSEPVVIETRRIGPEQLKPDRQPAGSVAYSGGRRAHRIGDLVYHGYGVEIRSSDVRFDGIRVDPLRGVRHRCGYAINGPSAWNAFDTALPAWTVHFAQIPGQDEVEPGAIEAFLTGAVPAVVGYRPGPSWPVYSSAGRFFVGVMHPTGIFDKSIIVAFANALGPSRTRIMARLPMPVERLSVTPGLHDANQHLNLTFRKEGGSLGLVVLQLDETSANKIAKALSH